MMHVQGTLGPLLGLAAVLALIAVALTRRALLGVPVRPVVINLTALPCGAVWPGAVRRHPRRLARPPAEVMSIAAQMIALGSLLFAAHRARNDQAIALPVLTISPRSVQRSPLSLTSTAAKKLLASLQSVGSCIKRAAACRADGLWRPALPVRGVYAGSVFRVPLTLASGTAERGRVFLEFARSPHKGFAAVRARDLYSGIERVCRASVVRGKPAPMTPTVAELLSAEAPAWGRAESCPAVVTDKDGHNKASLTRGADSEVRGRPVSVASRSGRFMRPSLSPITSIHYTTNGITAPQTALCAYNNPEAQRRDDREGMTMR